MKEDFIRDMGPLALANRLKRLSEVMMTSGRKMYKDLAWDIEPSWYLIFKLLQLHQSLSITEIANKLKYSHPSVMSITSKMVKKGYLRMYKNKKDSRKQQIELSQKAKDRLPEFEKLWQAGERAMKRLFPPGNTFFEMLNELDRQFLQSSFQQRTLMEFEKAKEHEIRNATPSDSEQIWEIFSHVIKEGETYPIPQDTPKKALQRYWFSPGMHSYVIEKEGKIVGTYMIKPNHQAAGSHVANTSYMIHPEVRGEGFGNKLCIDSLHEARRLGFTAMQFNIVVSTNVSAIHLWKKHGFQIIGTTPDGFLHPSKGLVDTHIMYRKL